jgi:hypothetical protein
MSFEEWWGLTFEKRGSIPYDRMPSPVDGDVLKRLRTEDVAELYKSEGVNSNSVRGILSGIELRRRENWTGRAALFLSVIAIVLAALHR